MFNFSLEVNSAPTLASVVTSTTCPFVAISDLTEMQPVAARPMNANAVASYRAEMSAHAGLQPTDLGSFPPTSV
jgi:hypothetical protein